ncbi:MAG: hypothetical protein LBT22_07830 [Peptococcaceae bacterium]|jgi:hypothetical protein|nr:hypothetical protein [Peptococcaceae bacterium]
MGGKRRSEQGFATLLTLCMLISLSVCGAESYYKASIENRIVQRRAQGLQAVYAAEAGLELAKAALKENPDWAQGDQLFTQGRVSVEVAAEGGGYWIVATGTMGLAMRKIKVFLELDEGIWIASFYQEIYS